MVMRKCSWASLLGDLVTIQEQRADPHAHPCLVVDPVVIIYEGAVPPSRRVWTKTHIATIEEIEDLKAARAS